MSNSNPDKPVPVEIVQDATGVSNRITHYLLFLLVFLSLAGLFDSFATQFRYTMTTYVRQDFSVSFGDLAGKMSWVYLASCLAFVPRMLADVLGRKPLLCITMVGLCVFQWGLGFARTPAEYIALLSLLAVFYKSDIWLLVMSEEAPPRYRGLWATLTIAIGGSGAVVLGQLVHTMGNAPAAWRHVAHFPIWGLVAVVPLLLFMRETQHFRQIKNDPRKRPTSALLFAPFRPKTRKPLILITLLKICFAGGAFVAIALMGSEYLRTENAFDRAFVGRIVQFDVLASILALVTSGTLSDIIGRRKCFFLLAGLYSTALFALALLPKGTHYIIAAYVLQSFAGTGIFAILRVATMELLPNDCRATGSAWSDLFMTLSAAGTAKLIGVLTTGKIAFFGEVPLSSLILGVAICVPLALPLYAFLPETKARKLEEV